jgi:hypothetical protein
LMQENLKRAARRQRKAGKSPSTNFENVLKY